MGHTGASPINGPLRAANQLATAPGAMNQQPEGLCPVCTVNEDVWFPGDRRVLERSAVGESESSLSSHS